MAEVVIPWFDNWKKPVARHACRISDATCLRASRVPEKEADRSMSGTLGSAAGETPGGGLVIAPARRVRRWC